MTEIMQNNIGYMKYTYSHRKAFRVVAEQLILQGYFDAREVEAIRERVRLHDMDKFVMYTVFSKPLASKLHREHSVHHLGNTVPKTKIDLIEAIIDWECAGLTKADKPLNAYDTLMAYFSEYQSVVLPLLKLFNMDYSYNVNEKYEPVAEEVVTEAMLVQEINNYLKGVA